MRWGLCTLITCVLFSAAVRCEAFALADKATAPITNGDFETKLDPWSKHIYAASSALDFDRRVKHGGAASLRITSNEPTDTALGQEIRLIPRQWYRFTGWIRTENLHPVDATVYGTYQIQLPGGRGIIAAGANHRDTTEWTEVAIVFRAPTDGQVRIAPFFAGFGTGTGTAWFDDLRLEPIDLPASPLRITRKPLYESEIGRFQYAQFIEYLCDSIPALWSEKLYDGSFEGLSPYNVAYLTQTDFREKPWYPSGATNRAQYISSEAQPISGKVAQEIRATGDTPCAVGLSQDGIAVEKDKACRFSCFLRQTGLAGDVEVLIHREGAILGSAHFHPSEDWEKFSARIVPADTCYDATLTIRFTGPARLWLDSASLMPVDNVGGWRRDAVEALREMHPGMIRFGGTALEAPSFGDFEWRDTIGDTDRRPPFRAWGGLQPTGPGLEEFVALCREVGAEPLMCVRTFKRTPKDAADQVEYFNGDTSTPMGKLRASNGHAAPYGIKYWQIGNERTGANYVAQLKPFADSMKRADRSIRLLSGFATKEIVQASAEFMDYICPHQYDCANLAACEAELSAIRHLLRTYAPGRNVKVAVTEWNTTAGDFGPERAKLWTLENALRVAAYQNLLHRNGDLVEIANRSNLSNSFCSGVIQTDNHRLYKTPAYYAQQLYATHSGSRALTIEAAVPVDVGPNFSATLSEDGRTLTAFVVNTDDTAETRTLDLSAFGAEIGTAIVWTLADRDHAREPDATNSFADPQRIAPIETSFRAPAANFAYEFPAYSLTVLQWSVSP